MGEANIITGDDVLYKLRDDANMAGNTFNAASNKIEIREHSAFAIGIAVAAVAK